MDDKEFKEWHSVLLRASLNSGKFGMDHPIGSCLMRDIFRDQLVKDALKDAWLRIVINKEEPKG